jgi:hypothetical protein
VARFVLTRRDRDKADKADPKLPLISRINAFDDI